MWQDRQAELLTNEIEAILSSLANEASFYHLVKESLTQAKRGLATKTTHDRPWPLLPLIVCEAVSGQYEHAMPAAAALQLFIAAGDIFDDIEDADSSESLSAKYGSAVATNVATTLLILAEKAITRLERRGVADQIIIHVMDVVNSSFTITCTGQHLDLSLNLEAAVSEDTYLRIADMKTASTVQCACHIGALLATGHQELIDTFAMFGQNLGMTFQIANDIQGITRGSDILKRKMTLPVIYALSQADGEARHQLELTFSKQSESASDAAQTRDLLFRTGAIHYATIKMEFYKQQALDILSKAEGEGANVERLKLFLE
jgi:geranylgeranyl pyrophosphate synthase